jgi:hypothetical protein
MGSCGYNVFVSRRTCAAFCWSFAFGLPCWPFAVFCLCGGDRGNELLISRGKLFVFRVGLVQLFVGIVFFRGFLWGFSVLFFVG